MHLALRRGGLASTSDSGQTWIRRCPPELGNGSSHDVGEHGYTWSDPTTKRLFYVTFGGLAAPRRRVSGRWSAGSLLSWSDDDGLTWVTQEIGGDTWDWPKVLAGAPRTGPVEGDHPNIMYFFGTHPFLLGPLRKVYRSRDGGRTWQPTANVAGDALEAGYGTVAPDGTIYIDEPYFLAGIGRLRGSPYRYRWREQGKLRLLISRDEGDSWEHRVIPDARAPLALYGIQRVAVDSEGTVYFAWHDRRDNLPYLSYSRDGGITWSERVMVAPPGVRRVHFQVQIAAREPGHVAISYYGTRHRLGLPSLIYVPDGRRHDGFITETFNATDPEPVFRTVQVNDPSEPLMPRARIADGAGEGQGIAFDSTGAPWATFTRVVEPWRFGLSVFMKDPPTTLFVGRLR